MIEQSDTQQSVQPHIFALSIAGGWIVLELLVRWGGGLLLQSVVESLFAADWLLFLVGFPLIALFLSVVALRYGRSFDDWGYNWSARAIGFGIIAIGIAFVVTAATGVIDGALFGLEESGAEFIDEIGGTIRAVPILAVVLLLGNGVAVPIAEEHVWRGLVQTELVAAWGAGIGILVTAIIFTSKHIIVDLAIFRVTTLLALGLLFGIVRHRYGTGSSIVLHIGVNLIASAAIVFAAFA